MTRQVIQHMKNPYMGVFFAYEYNLGNPTFDEIISAVIEVTKIPKERLMSNFGRHHDAVLARGICYILIKRCLPDMSYTEIGKRFGGFDHTTIPHNIKSANNRIEQEQEVSAFYDRITDAIKYRKLKEA